MKTVAKRLYVDRVYRRFDSLSSKLCKRLQTPRNFSGISVHYGRTFPSTTDGLSIHYRRIFRPLRTFPIYIYILSVNINKEERKEEQQARLFSEPRLQRLSFFPRNKSIYLEKYKLNFAGCGSGQ